MSLPTLKLVVVASVLALVALLPPCGAQLKGGGSGLGIALMQQEQEAAEIEIQPTGMMVEGVNKQSLFPQGTLASEEPGAQAPPPPPKEPTSPYAWQNWEGTVRCQPAFLAYPVSIDEVAQLVKGHSRVRAVGLGHSFNKFACSSDLMISTMQMASVLELDTKQLTVTTQPGISTRRLMDWLADQGYALPSVPFYIDQTIGGAVATGTHGSSLTLGSLSSLVKQMKVVLADGTVKTITEADGDLMHVARTSVGLLGVIVEVTLAVVKDDVVLRETSYIHDHDLLRDLKLAAVHPSVANSVQYWYSPPIKTAVRTHVAPLHGHHHRGQPDVGRAVSELYLRIIKGSPYERLFLRLLAYLMKNENSSTAASFNVLSHTIYSSLPGKFKTSSAFSNQQLAETDVLQQVYGKYDQYEFAIPLDKAHGCFSALFDMMDRNITNRDDFLVPFCLRYVGSDKEAFLSQSHGGARFYANIDSYYRTYRNGTSRSLQAIKDLMKSPTCQARMHFGKAGMFASQGGLWTQADAAYTEATYGADTIARVRKVLDQYDPNRKFGDIDNLLCSLKRQNE